MDLGGRGCGENRRRVNCNQSTLCEDLFSIKKNLTFYNFFLFIECSLMPSNSFFPPPLFF